jgi:hypothetical protein
LVESLDSRPSNQYILVRESPSCLRLAQCVCVPGKAAVKMKSKVFEMVLLMYLHFIYMDLLENEVLDILEPYFGVLHPVGRI